RLLKRHAHIQDRSTLQDCIRKMLERPGIAAVLATAGEFDQGSCMIVIGAIVTDLLAIGQAQSFDEHMPELVEPEITLFIAMQARQTKALAQDLILFEPGPEQREIIEDIQT